VLLGVEGRASSLAEEEEEPRLEGCWLKAEDIMPVEVCVVVPLEFVGAKDWPGEGKLAEMGAGEEEQGWALKEEDGPAEV